MPGKLEGRRIVVPETRSLDLFCSMLEREGATAIRSPLIAIHDVSDPAPVVAWLRRLTAGDFDDLFLSTGEGVNRLVGVAQRAGFEAEVIAAFGKARIVCRGPKPLNALRKLGLSAEIVAEPATTAGVIETVKDLDLKGHRVGVQLYPQAPDTLVDFLKEKGAEPVTILCYRYASAEEDGEVADMIGMIVDGQVDLIAFTSAPQVRRLRDIAEKLGCEDALKEAFDKTVVAVVGPICAEAVTKAGWPVHIMPEENFHLKPFVNEMAAALARSEAGAGA